MADFPIPPSECKSKSDGVDDGFGKGNTVAEDGDRGDWGNGDDGTSSMNSNNLLKYIWAKESRELKASKQQEQQQEQQQESWPLRQWKILCAMRQMLHDLFVLSQVHLNEEKQQSNQIQIQIQIKSVGFE